MRTLSRIAWTAGLCRGVSEMLVLLAPAKKLQRPNLALVSSRRWPLCRRVPNTAAWEVVPNLAIEVSSPTNFANDTLEKFEHYFLSGVERVWVVYPTVAKPCDYESSSIRILARDQTLDGGTWLAGFHLPMAEFFENEAPGDEVPGRRWG